MVIPWLREGVDPDVTYGVVSGQAAPLVKDHFIELQFLQSYLIKYYAAISLDTFTNLVGAILSCARWFSLYNLGSLGQFDK